MFCKLRTCKLCKYLVSRVTCLVYFDDISLCNDNLWIIYGFKMCIFQFYIYLRIRYVCMYVCIYIYIYRAVRSNSPPPIVPIEMTQKCLIFDRVYLKLCKHENHQISCKRRHKQPFTKQSPDSRKKHVNNVVVRIYCKFTYKNEAEGGSHK